MTKTIRDELLGDDNQVSEKLHQSINQVIIQGWVNKKEIEEIKNDEGKEFIKANIDIRTSETNIIPIEMFAAKLTKDGKENSIYKGIQTIDREYVDATQVEKWQDATKVRITTGQIRSSEFLGNDEEVHCNIKYNTNFINRIKDNEDFVPQAKFNVEVIFMGDREETKNGDPTGRGYIDGFYVDFNGKLNPVYFVVPEKYWNKVQGELEKNETIFVFGDIISNAVTKVITLESDFGEDDERIITTTVKERVMTGIKRVEEEKSFEKKLIKEALKQREKDLESLKAKSLFAENSNSDNNVKNNSNDEDELPFLV